MVRIGPDSLSKTIHFHPFWQSPLDSLLWTWVLFLTSGQQLFKTLLKQFYSVLYKLSIGVMVGIQVIFKHNIDQYLSLIATAFLFEDIFRFLLLR